MQIAATPEAATPETPETQTPVTETAEIETPEVAAPESAAPELEGATRLTATLAWSAGQALDAVRHPRIPATRGGKVLALVLVAVLVSGIGGYAWYRAHTLPEGAAFAVGDRVVTVAQLDDRVQTLRALYGVQPPLDDPAGMDRFRRDAAKAVAVTMVLQDRADELGVGVADTKVRDTLNQYIVAQFGAGPTAHDQFVTVLGNVGTSEPAVLDEIRQQMGVSEVFNRVTEGVATSDADVEAAFPQYADRLGVPEKRALRNIVVTNQDQAQQVVTQLQAGAVFADVARATSIDSSTRETGGELGSLAAAQLLPDYAAAAFGTPVGQVYGPLQNQFGWNVGQVAAVTPGQPAQFDQVKDQLRQLVDFDRRVAAWSDWMREAITGADVRYAEDYLPADPDSIPTGAQPGVPAAPAAPAPPAAPAVPGIPAAPAAPADPVAPAVPAPGAPR